MKRKSIHSILDILETELEKISTWLFFIDDGKISFEEFVRGMWERDEIKGQATVVCVSF
jgi:hypothetical protein